MTIHIHATSTIHYTLYAAYTSTIVFQFGEKLYLNPLDCIKSNKRLMLNVLNVKN
jgi:hypothetical protein